MTTTYIDHIKKGSDNWPIYDSRISDSDITNWNSAGGISGTGVTAIIALTESQYDALVTKSATTLYVVTPDPS